MASGFDAGQAAHVATIDPSVLTAAERNTLSRLDSSLANLLVSGAPATGNTASRGGSGSGTASPIRTLNGIEGVTVDVTATDGDGAALLARLQAIGLQAGASFGAVASGFIPVADLPSLLDVDGLASAQASLAGANAPAIPPEASNALHATPARSTYGVDGTGLTVGILSDSFNKLSGSDTMATDIANGYLPANTAVLQDDPYSDGEDEGRGMAQIVHQIAPGAGILFDTAEGGQATFAQHILDLAAAGAKVIVDDVTYFAEPAYQNGVIAQAIEQVEKQGVVYLSSAGNNGMSGYEGAFKSGGTFTYNGKTYTTQNFGTGAAGTDQSLLPFTVGSKGRYYDFNLQWSQPAASASAGHGATSDLDLFILDGNGNVIGSPLTSNNIGGDPSEDGQYYFNSSGPYYLKVGLASGSTAPTDIKIRIGGNGLPVSISPVSTNYNTGTLFGHNGGGTGYSGVGAVSYKDTPYYSVSPPENEAYSSGGPDYIYYDDQGSLLSSPTIHNVAFSATDGVDTSFFPTGSNQDSDGDGFPNFFGTSAAAPSAAAVAALLLQKTPSLTPVQVQQIEEYSAIATVDATGTADPGIGGAGFIQADKALSVTSTIGSGPDQLALNISEDAYQGNAQYTVAVDGQQIGGVMTASSAHGTASDTLLVNGTWSAGSHLLTIDFLNDAYGGSAATDRNLYMDGAIYNGTKVPDPPIAFYMNGAVSLAFGTVPPVTNTTTLGTGPKQLALSISEDAYQGNAVYTVAVDGQQIGGTVTASSSHGSGDDTVLVNGNWAPGNHTVSVDFLNDLYGGSASEDRNLYVDGVNYQGMAVLGAQGGLFQNGSKSFAFNDMTAPAQTTTIGSGSDELSLDLSEDAYQGDAQYTVAVDGQQIGGLQSASAPHGSASDLLLVKGDWSAGQHTFTVTFKNDLYNAGPGGGDRNIYLDGATYNGATVSGAQAQFYENGSKSFAFQTGMAGA